MRIHKEGYTLIAITAAHTLAGIAIILFWIPLVPGLKILFILPLLVLLLFVIRFFRMPYRELLPDDNLVLSPADGKVVVIEEVTDAEYFGDRRTQVSIFMSPHDIHVNWFPIKGIVSYFRYFPGKYLVAWHPKSSMENERTSVVIENDRGDGILVRQIAGAVARRVVCYAKTDHPVQQGDELGFIKFGSRVDLLLPPHVHIHVSVGQRVTGRETVIASFPEWACRPEDGAEPSQA
ncbi:MAG TPA: phosphatidylserine decarboxylase family protein [Bacteroidales bacterium]|nr:phosphatidylserine decarboxylase family protein [Lentimicrobiaceae bacterium]HOI00640.1 phosphatidylserine decarboxylase family protein [Bacteroidales bacterium]